MSRITSLALPALAVVLAGALGFFGRQKLDQTVPAEDAPQGRAAERPLSDAAPESDAVPKDTDLPARTPEELHALALEQHDAHEWIAGARTAFRWVQLHDASQLEKQIEAWSKRSEYVRILHNLPELALIGLAELEPQKILEKFADNQRARWAAYAAMLIRDPETTLAKCPEEMREFCQKFIAARHPRFDLAWARSFGVSPSWFVRTWLHRGIKVSDLLKNPENLDAEIVSALFLHEVTQPGGRDAARLAALLKRIDDPTLLKAARDGIAGSFGWVEEPLETLMMFQLLEISLPEPKGGPYVNPAHYYHAALSNRPEETVAWLLALDPDARQKALKGIFTNSLSGNTNTKGWLDLYLRLPREELPHFHRLSMYLGRELSSPTTLAWFENVALGNQFPAGDAEKNSRSMFLDMARNLGGTLVAAGLESALTRAREIEDEGLRQAVLGGIGQHIVEFDLEGARALLPELEGDQRATVAGHILRKEFKESPLELALQNLRDTPDPQQQSAAASAILFDPTIPHDSRAAVVDQFREANRYLFDASLGLVIEWARESPAEAAAWINKYADHKRYAGHVQHLVESWARHDIVGAANWVIDQEPGEAKDRGIRAIAEHALDRDPHAALEWATSISNEKQRRSHLENAVLAIDTFATEQDEARQAIGQLDLSEEERAQLLQHLGD